MLTALHLLCWAKFCVTCRFRVLEFSRRSFLSCRTAQCCCLKACASAWACCHLTFLTFFLFQKKKLCPAVTSLTRTGGDAWRSAMAGMRRRRRPHQEAGHPASILKRTVKKPSIPAAGLILEPLSGLFHNVPIFLAARTRRSVFDRLGTRQQAE